MREVVNAVEVLAFEDRVGRVGEHLIAGERYAQFLADRAAGAVAGGEILRFDASRLACRAINYLRGDAILMFDE